MLNFAFVILVTLVFLNVDLIILNVDLVILIRNPRNPRNPRISQTGHVILDVDLVFLKPDT